MTPPIATINTPTTRPEFYLDVVVRSGLDVSVADAITAGDIERTMDGASTLTLTLHDPHRALVRNPDMARAIDMRFHGYWWRLVKLSKAGDALTLTFEDRDIAYLRSHSKPRKAARGKVTRAQFVRQLVREVGQRQTDAAKDKKKNDKKAKAKAKDRKPAQKPITFVCPELRQRQPVAKRSESERTDNRESGISRDARLTVKKKRATVKQKKNGERCLDIAARLNAGPKATLALMEAVIIESLVKNLTTGDADSIGILQVRVSQHGRSVAASIEKSVRQFLTKGFTGKGGAIALAKKHGDWTAAEVAAAVQGPKVPVYHTVHDEAEKWIEEYGGASGSDSGGSSRSDSSRSRKKYEFRRGEPGKPEDSWTAIQRLAEEVRWHAFMDRGKLYYVSDNWLMKQKARFVIDEDDAGVQEINFDIDQGKKVAEVTVLARADQFKVPVGSIIRVEKVGLASGRYIVRSVRQSIFDDAVEMTLQAPTPKLPEPAQEEEAQTARAGTSSTTKGGTLREKIVAVAKASAAAYRKHPGGWHYQQGNHQGYPDPTKAPPAGTRNDCSQWIGCVYKKAGAPAPGPSYNVSIWTGNMAVKGKEVSLSSAKPGDIILFGAPPYHHVELYVGPGNKTIGHGSDPVDAGTTNMQANPHCWRYNFLDD